MDHLLITGEGEVESLPEVMTPRAELLKTIAEKGFDPDSHVAGEAWGAKQRFQPPFLVLKETALINVRLIE
jgi:hypothetical protein